MDLFQEFGCYTLGGIFYGASINLNFTIIERRAYLQGCTKWSNQSYLALLIKKHETT
jgi:hypothetical protein